MKKKLFVAVIVGITLLISGCNKKGDVAQKKQESTQTLNNEVQEQRALTESEYIMDAKKMVDLVRSEKEIGDDYERIVKGEVVKLQEQESELIIYLGEKGNYEGKGKMVKCVFQLEDNDKQALSTIQEGQQIVVWGRYYTKYNNEKLRVDSCEIVDQTMSIAEFERQVAEQKKQIEEIKTKVYGIKALMDEFDADKQAFKRKYQDYELSMEGEFDFYFDWCVSLKEKGKVGEHENVHCSFNWDGGAEVETKLLALQSGNIVIRGVLTTEYGGARYFYLTECQLQ